MSGLRAVRDNAPALTLEELHAVGNRLVTEARDAALDAIRASMIPDYMHAKRAGGGLKRADILRWRSKAHDAGVAWAKVDAICTHLLNEMEKTEADA